MYRSWNKFCMIWVIFFWHYNYFISARYRYRTSALDPPWSLLWGGGWWGVNFFFIALFHVLGHVDHFKTIKNSVNRVGKIFLFLSKVITFLPEGKEVWFWIFVCKHEWPLEEDLWQKIRHQTPPSYRTML